MHPRDEAYLIVVDKLFDVLLDRQEVLAAVRNNEIPDAKTLIGLQHWLLAEAV